MTPVQLQVIAQISRALRRLGADLALLETLNDRAYADQAHNN